MHDMNNANQKMNNEKIEKMIRKILNRKYSYQTRQKNLMKISEGNIVIPIEIIKKLLDETKHTNIDCQHYKEVVADENEDGFSISGKGQPTITYTALVRFVTRILKINELIQEIDDDPYYEYFVLDICCNILDYQYKITQSLTKKEWEIEKNNAKVYVEKNLTSQNKQLVVKTLQFLEEYASQEYEKKIIALLTDDDFYVRAKAAAALWWLETKVAPQSLIDLLKDSYPYVRLCAVLALGKFSNGKIFDQYVEIIQNQYEAHEVRVQALRSLSNSNDPRVIDFIITLLNNERNDCLLYEAGIKTIHNYYEYQLFGTYSQLLTMENNEHTRFIAHDLGIIDTRKSIDLLFTILEKNIDSKSGEAAISSLKELGKKQSDDNKRKLVERLLLFINKTQHKDYMINSIKKIISPERLIPYLNKLNTIYDDEIEGIINDIKRTFTDDE